MTSQQKRTLKKFLSENYDFSGLSGFSQRRKLINFLDDLFPDSPSKRVFLSDNEYKVNKEGDLSVKQK